MLKLNHLQISGFKSIKKMEIPIKRLNLFIGPNNSGKSSILQSLLLLKQSYDSSKPNYDSIYNFKGFEEIVTDKNQEQNININLKQQIPIPLKERFELFKTSPSTIETNFEFLSHQRSFVRSNLIHANSQLLEHLYDSTKEDSIPFHANFRNQIDSPVIGGSSGGNLPWLSFNRALKPSKEKYIKQYPEGYKKLKALNSITKGLTLFYQSFFNNMIFIPVERGSLTWETKAIGSMPQDIETRDNGQTLFNILFHMLRREYSLNLNQIKKWAKEFGIDELTPYPTNSSIPSCGVETVQSHSKEPFQLVSLGFGCRQVLYLLIMSLIAPSESLILIEEPEIHLHPAYQIKIIDFLVDNIIKDKKQFLVTTHSEYLLLRLQNVVLEGKLSPKDVGLYYLSLEEGYSKIKELEFHPEGNFEMPGFHDITQQEYQKWLRLKAKPIPPKNS